jgi:hypothetical protein
VSEEGADVTFESVERVMNESESSLPNVRPQDMITPVEVRDLKVLWKVVRGMWNMEPFG